MGAKYHMNKKSLIFIALILIVICFVVLTIWGREYTLCIDVSGEHGDAEAFSVDIESREPVVVLLRQQRESDDLLLTFRSVHPGTCWVTVSYPSGESFFCPLYVHAIGTLTAHDIFGDCTGDFVIAAAAIVFSACLLFSLIRRYRNSVRQNLYRYANVRDLGLIFLFSSLLLLTLLPAVFRGGGIIKTVQAVLSFSQSLSSLTLPLAFVLSILIAFSNIQLMRREGRNWHNMLGFLLGAFLCFGTLFPLILNEILQRSYSSVIDVHNLNRPDVYIESIVEHSIYALVAYLECVMTATVILGVKAARRIPSFDKDYILILGSQIREDGTLPPLLKGRADRALSFAAMQKDAGGKEIVFVPSGGQGPDESVSEADAIRRYLLEKGVPEDRILTEDRSANTAENLRNSAALIRETASDGEPKIAFSTTNYHVFRSGLLATAQGIRAEGIGSPTKSYFWVNAFIREFIATLYAERKTHIRVLVFLLLMSLLGTAILYLSNNPPL